MGEGRTAPAPLLRGAVVGAAATGLAVGGHALSAAERPAWPVVVQSALAVGVVAVALSRFRWTFPRLLAVLLGAQPLLHAAFVWSAPGHLVASDGAALPGAAMPHMSHTDMFHSGMPAAGNPLADWLTRPDMALWHLLAAVLTAVLLSRGETWLTGVLDALALRAVRMLHAVGTYGVRPQPVPVVVHRRPRQPAAAGAWWQRGPPC